ncbi:hypothetical protein LIER_19809 [Lithospermum erythrorhizon]|uniref:DUF4283 domain-containing protein n=1 Tax=Lithospermum erythrorhizon TaxID=34254 RepID=A0AAV3QJ33_LITER
MYRLASGIFLSKFKSVEDNDCMLASGPSMFAKRPMILKSWTPEANLEKKGAEKVPIWIRVPHLSLQFWNEEIFSKIASYIGTPLYDDSATSKMARLSFGRLCIEVDAAKVLPKEVPLDEHFKFGGRKTIPAQVNVNVGKRMWKPKEMVDTIENGGRKTKSQLSEHKEEVPIEEDVIVDSIVEQPTIMQPQQIEVTNSFDVLDDVQQVVVKNGCIK